MPTPALTDAQAALYPRICAHPLDRPNEPRSFTMRLAEQNGWSLDYARRVVDEYRRFVFLAMVSRHAVTPSDEVDQAWHLHLCDSRDYWEVFCPQILGQAFHHEAGRGQAGEAEQHALQYRETLASYQTLFGEAPPADIWPTHRPHQHMVRLDRAQHWVWRRPPLSRLPAPALLVGALGSALLAGCAELDRVHGNVLNLDGPHFLFFYFCAWVAFALLARVASLLGGLADDSQSRLTAPQIDVFERAYLGGGARRAVETALLKLILHEQLTVDDKGVITQVAPPGLEGRAFETQIWPLLKPGMRYRDAVRQLAPRGERLKARLVDQRLVQSDETVARRRGAYTLIGTGLWLLGAAKVVVGLSRDRPVGILVFALIAIAVVAGLMKLAGRKRIELTRAGRAFQRESRLSARDIAEDRDLQLNRFAVLGVTALIGTQWAYLTPYVTPANTGSSVGSSGGDGGGSCGGGSSCGGGGGGCGGCGGGGD
ncbi:MAG: TIGR04222 domain-containing membrane protein [Burkholderiales bacterium]|nr:TIGR04222 domain-containing membrane protein [Burkholderiales bacterium]